MRCIVLLFINFNSEIYVMSDLTKAAQEELDSFGTLSEKTAKLLIAENEKLSDELKTQVEERVFICNGDSDE